jgi:serine/threonine-protein kinase
MKQEEWNQIDELFEEALNRAPHERSAFLDWACDGNESRRREVESLLMHDEQAQTFLEQPPGAIAAALLNPERFQFQPGQFIDHYKVIDRLGAGGMGEVYLARDARLERQVAIKVLLPQFTCDSDKVRRFEQEARAASALNHPNIVTIHEVGEVDGVHYIVAECIEGQTLSKRLAQKGRMDIGEALGVALQIANALDAAHAAGIVHRDIKPDNIMLRPDGFVKVLDFGLAKLSYADFANFETNPGAVMGTARYMSPEQAMGERVDARSDIWSLGVVLFEMLAGKPPFDGETPSHAIVDVLDNPSPSLAAHVKDAPRRLESVLRRCLSKKLDERYQTAKEFADDLISLREQLQDRGTLSRPLAAASRPLASVARWKRIVIAAAALVLAVGAFLFLAKPDKSVAVTPFINAGDTATEYLSDGIAEDIENNLSRVPQLRVVRKAAQDKDKNAAVDPRAIGRELGVRTILTGRLVPSGDYVEVHAELLNTDNGARLWGDTYRRQLVGLRSIEREIAAAVVSKLGLQNGVAKLDTNSNEAHLLYLQGRYYWAKSGARGANEKMGEYFLKAIEVDSNYALAWAGLADYYATQTGGGTMSTKDEAWHKSEEAAVKALSIDESTAEAHHSLAAVRLWYDRSWRDAEVHLKRAIELKPDFAEGYALYAGMLDAQGRFDEAIAASKRAQEVDPQNTTHRRGNGLGTIYYHWRRYDLAVEELRKDVDKDPSNPNTYINLGEAYVQQKKFTDALAEAQKAKILVRNPKQKSRLGALLAAAGDVQEATKILVETEQFASEHNTLAVQIAAMHVALGNKNEAIDWLTKSLDEHDEAVIDLKVDPRFDPLRQDPRFIALLGGRMHLLP